MSIKKSTFECGVSALYSGRHCNKSCSFCSGPAEKSEIIALNY